MNLIEELMKRGFRLRYEGSGNYRVAGHRGLIVKNDFWYSHSIGKGGAATTLLAEMNQDYYGPDRPHQSNHSFTKIHHDLKWKENRHPLNIHATNYLLTRHIDLQLIRHPYIEQKRLICYDGKGYLCFMGYDESGQVKCISKRAIDSSLNVQRYEAKGSDKYYSFHMPSKTPSKTVILVEGPIDALSVACLENRKYHNGYFCTHKIATCGAPTSTIRKRLHHLKCDHIILAFDQDLPGKTMTKRVVSELKNLNIKITEANPGIGKDPNDWLRNISKSP